MRLGILTALAAEAARLPRDDARLLGSHEFISVVTGPGPTRARLGAAALVARGAEALLSFGLAGGIDPALRPARLVLAHTVHAEDGACFACASELHDALLAALAGLHVVVAPIASVAAPLATRAAKLALHARHGCVAVDMESAAVAQVASAHGLPFVVVRAVVDPADFSLPRAALVGMGEDGTNHPLATARALLLRPGELPALLRLALWYGAGLRALGAAARAVSA